MKTATQNRFSCARNDHKDGVLHTAKTKPAVGRADHWINREYLPMDVYVDPTTVKPYFEVGSICAQ